VTLGDALARATARLAAAGVESARLEAELLLAKACDDCARALLYAELDRELTPEQVQAFGEQVARREKREPLAYVLGEWGFRRLTLKTDRRALIPRPETEIVVERALVRLHGLEAPRVLDVGTGSGAIALAIADEHPGARVTAIDVSADALSLARENAARTGLTIELLQHDLREGLPGGPYDLVVSNPPYVTPEEYETLQPEIRLYEPYEAVVGVGVGTQVAAQSRALLRPGGRLVLECGDGQAVELAEALRRLGYAEVMETKDLAGRDRVVEGTWNGS
jgi:release factor glutamine methyltransferase